MCIQKNLLHGAWITLLGIVITIMTLAMSSNAYAQAAPPYTENGTCASCHEDLYFLHDTGNWFCLRESPMQCVDCHGGNPLTFNQKEAHANRKPHPIVNEDVSKCQECHPAECDDRVTHFEDIAGISDVLIAAPYQPKPTGILEQSLDAQTTDMVEHPGWLSAMEVLVLALIISIVLIIYFLNKKQHTHK